jgi:hypothetical protein
MHRVFFCPEQKEQIDAEGEFVHVPGKYQRKKFME